MAVKSGLSAQFVEQTFRLRRPFLGQLHSRYNCAKIVLIAEPSLVSFGPGLVNAQQLGSPGSYTVALRLDDACSGVVDEAQPPLLFDRHHENRSTLRRSAMRYASLGPSPSIARPRPARAATSIA